jgi:hypothetical protein
MNQPIQPVMRNSASKEKFKKITSKLNKFRIPGKLVLIIVGFVSTIWFLIRVIPKPQRAAYPCMRAAAPWASAFVLYLIGLTGSVLLFKRSLRALRQRKFAMVLLFIPAILAVGLVTLYKNPAFSNAAEIVPLDEIIFPENPVGEGKGLFPGRVVWVYNEHATNRELANEEGDYWYMDKNTNQDTIKKMLDQSIMHLTEGATVNDAWDKLFKHFNAEKGKGNVGYASGEKIAIKINLVNSLWGTSGTEMVTNMERMDQTPQLVYALLETLINDLGINQSDITIGDSYRTFRDFYWNKCHTAFPNVVYIDGIGMNNRAKTQLSSANVLVFSDGTYTSTLPQHYVEADYFINGACLKSHEENGLTLCAKNHQGSVVQPGGEAATQFAEFMHYSMTLNDPGYGKYRHLVDYMGHEHTGGKTLLYLVDGIWGGDNWEGNIFRWQMPPFNDDYPNSIFVSQDPVAIEAVGFDFLLEEYTNPPVNNNVPRMDGETNKYPYYNGVNDYMLQAADEAYWPDGFTYDPEGDGSKLGSLGVYEHWNNGTDKEYSGSGIDFVKVTSITQSPSAMYPINAGITIAAYPNPFTEEITIDFTEMKAAKLIHIYNYSGKKVFSENVSKLERYTWYGHDNNGSQLSAGNYLVQITADNAVSSLRIVKLSD